MCHTVSHSDRITSVGRGCRRAMHLLLSVVKKMTSHLRKYLISRKFPGNPKNAAQNFNHPPESTFPPQVPAITNSNLLRPGSAAQFIIRNSEFIIFRPRLAIHPNTPSLHKNTFKPRADQNQNPVHPSNPEILSKAGSQIFRCAGKKGFRDKLAPGIRKSRNRRGARCPPCPGRPRLRRRR
jgi:hypothetical protein